MGDKNHVLGKEFLERLIDKALEHPEFIRVIIEAYFDKVAIQKKQTLIGDE